jgi:hypothetical protein
MARSGQPTANGFGLFVAFFAVGRRSSPALDGAKGRRSGESIEESEHLVHAMTSMTKSQAPVGVGVSSNRLRRHAVCLGGMCTTPKKEDDA